MTKVAIKRTLFLFVFCVLMFSVSQAIAGYGGNSVADVKSKLINRFPVETHKIKLCSQVKCQHFLEANWKNNKYNLTGSMGNMCNRASLSMALSWVGVDCTQIGRAHV